MVGFGATGVSHGGSGRSRSCCRRALIDPAKLSCESSAGWIRTGWVVAAWNRGRAAARCELESALGWRETERLVPQSYLLVLNEGLLYPQKCQSPKTPNIVLLYLNIPRTRDVWGFVLCPSGLIERVCSVSV